MEKTRMYKMRSLFTRCLAFLLIAVCCVSCAKSVEDTWQEQYDLGIRYLNDGDYEQAIIAFTAAIEIDPKRPEAYLNIIDAYLAQDDIVTALEYAKTGAELTGNEELIHRSEELEQRAAVELCGHEWTPATFEQPETCSKCGATRGEPVATYFSDNDLPIISDLPEEAVHFKYVVYNINDATDFFVSDQGEYTITQNIQDADEPGYRQIELTAIRRTPIEYRVSEDEFPYARAQMDVRTSTELYDAYTGRIIAGLETFQSADENGVLGAIRGYEATIEFNGEPRQIRYTLKSSWESEGWTINAENGYNVLLGMSVNTYTFILPEEYDGLLFAVEPVFNYPTYVFEEPPVNTDASVIDLSEDVLAETVFIKVG